MFLKNLKNLNIARIVKRGSKWVLLSKKGKKLGEFKTKKEAEKREMQILHIELK